MNHVSFDAERHEYVINNLIKAPSVTQILKAGGLGPDLSGIDPEVLTWKANLGTQVHAATALDDQGLLDTYDEQIEGYLQAWRAFKNDMNFRPKSIEFIVYSDALHYAGTLDRIGIIETKKGDVEAVFDIKTGVVDLAYVGPQTAAYEYTLHHPFYDSPELKRYAVKISEDGKYKLVQLKNPMDFQIFLACLNLYSWKGERHGYR